MKDSLPFNSTKKNFNNNTINIIPVPPDTITPTGRFAPSPSGRMHLGNIYTALAAWAMIRSCGGRFLLRMEDLDPLRCPKANAKLVVEDLKWLGLDWDNEPPYQSERTAIYEYYYKKLAEQGLTYPCYCSRSQLHVAEAPHASDGHLLYPGICRGLTAAQQAAKALSKSPAYRLQLPDKAVSFTDGNYGHCSYNLAAEWGDIILRRSDGIYAYQLAVTVDDALMGVTQVVRGCDLLTSTPVQLYLQKQLGFSSPSYFHLPLLLSPEGSRLAKRNKAAGMDYLRAKYPHPEPIIGYLSYLLGQISKPEPIKAQELVTIFDKEKIPREDIVVEGDI